jgi:hypothetical protein
MRTAHALRFRLLRAVLIGTMALAAVFIGLGANMSPALVGVAVVVVLVEGVFIGINWAELRSWRAVYTVPIRYSFPPGANPKGLDR